MSIIDDSTKLFVTEAIAKSTKDNLEAIREVFEPLEKRLQELETDHYQRVGAKGVYKFLAGIGIGLIAGFVQYALHSVIK